MSGHDPTRGAPGPGENVVSGAIIGAAIEVHRHVGAGMLESIYETCLCRELSLRGIAYERQRPLQVVYKGEVLDATYRLDLVVEGCVVVEVKAVEEVLPVHKAQLLTYLRLTGLRLGLLLNFKVPVLTRGISRVVLGLEEP
jgi:GxxExxY protein